ncbi:MAG TPA: sigma-54 dependent transcriptional regulator [Acidobacteriaceae bacterium]|nr:sigma-54 dependent transcriptional regulator [Acidobacteriaceae bacterium]
MAEALSIVIIDDNPGSLELLATALAHTDAAVYTSSNPVAGLELVRKHRPGLVVTDLVMPEMSGLEVLQQVVGFDSSIDVILMTAHYTPETAVAAIRQGAADYLQKPVKIGLLRERVASLIESANLRKRVRASTSNGAQDLEFEGLQAKSDPMWNLFAMIQRVAPHYRSVLIQGPTGAGKDLIATALHHRSQVPGKFVVLNCSAVVETLFESELFGHVRGAFTGADRDKSGLFELANGGTLFLDEIGDMPLPTQAKLLRAIQNQEILPVGSLTSHKVNVRIVAATHRDLRAAIAAGNFREDLYYRLSMVELTVPPLKDRPEDIPLLARHFVRKFSGEFAKRIGGLTPRALLVLERYGWPGNVRELEHIIGRACMLTDDIMLDVDSLPESLIHTEAKLGTGEESTSLLEDQERQLIADTLRAVKGNQSEAARRLGIGRDALRYKIKRYELSV